MPTERPSSRPIPMRVPDDVVAEFAAARPPLCSREADELKARLADGCARLSAAGRRLRRDLGNVTAANIQPRCASSSRWRSCCSTRRRCRW